MSGAQTLASPRNPKDGSLQEKQLTQPAMSIVAALRAAQPNPNRSVATASTMKANTAPTRAMVRTSWSATIQ